jgi:signal transduction histidine kinase
MSLASNARDAMSHGGKFTLETNVIELEQNSPRLRRWMKPGEYIVLSISDNGTGMDFNTRCHCFEPFSPQRTLAKA